MASKKFEIPEEWGLTERREFIIRTLTDSAGSFVAPVVLCVGLYPNDPHDKDMVAPPKLRFMIMKCRKVLSEHTGGVVGIISAMGRGYKISTTGFAVLKRIVSEP